MFTGITEKLAEIEDVREHQGIRMVHVRKPSRWKVLRGQSVMIDGICSTVMHVGATTFTVEYMNETLAKTTAGSWAKGRMVNLERSVTPRTMLDGHIVQGHVDDVAKVDERQDGVVHIRLPRELARYVAPRGSIAVNGVSLTIARVKGRDITVALIPHTLKHTNLDALQEGDVVNIETDLIARYLDTLRA